MHRIYPKVGMGMRVIVRVWAKLEDWRSLVFMSLRDDDDLMRVGRAHGKAGSAGPSLFADARLLVSG